MDFQSLSAAFAHLFQPATMLICMLSAVIGIVLGALPGLSGATGIMIMLPITYGMDPINAFAMLMSLWVGGASGSFISAVLIGIPGSSGSVATVYDGYEMTKNGEAVRALSAGTVSNFFGTLPSVLIAMFCSVTIAKLAINLGPWDYFALGFTAITLVISLSEGSLLKGLISAGLGLAVTTFGIAPVSGTPRFTFGSNYLTGGFSMIPVMMGCFAGSLILLEYARGEKMGGDTDKNVKVSHFRLPLQDIKDNAVNIIRSFGIGAWIGFLPGMGASLSNVASYAIAKQSSKHPEKMGTGAVEGVFASEAANNASLGGAIIPLVALGIPGDGTSAILLSGLTIQGMEAGPMLIRNQPVFVYTIFAAALFGAIFVLLTEILSIPLFPRLLQIPYRYLYPTIFILVVVGTYVESNNLFSVYMFLLFTLLAVLMNMAKLPMSPFILAYVLGDMLEKNLRNAISYAPNGGAVFFTEPLSCILITVSILSVMWSLWKSYKAKRKANA